MRAVHCRGLGTALCMLALVGCHVDSLFRAVGAEPPEPTNLQQLHQDGATPLALGAAAAEPSVALRGTISSADAGATVRLEVEVRPVTEPFQNVRVAVSDPVAPGTSVTVAVGDLVDETGYRWQARAVDHADRASDWVPFGGVQDTTTHFRIAVPDPPAAPSNLGQFKSNGNAKLNAGATTTETTVVLKAVVTDPDSMSLIRLEAELQPVGSPFTNEPTAIGLAAVVNGGTASVTINDLAPGSYHWQVRAVDQTNLRSDWVAFGTGGADFHVAP